MTSGIIFRIKLYIGKFVWELLKIIKRMKVGRKLILMAFKYFYIAKVKFFQQFAFNIETYLECFKYLKCLNVDALKKSLVIYN